MLKARAVKQNPHVPRGKRTRRCNFHHVPLLLSSCYGGSTYQWPFSLSYPFSLFVKFLEKEVKWMLIKKNVTNNNVHLINDFM